MKYIVNLSSVASFAVEVEIPDDLEPEEARDAAIDAAFDRAPSDVCVHCAGFRQKWSLELGEWEVARDEADREIQPRLMES